MYTYAAIRPGANFSQDFGAVRGEVGRGGDTGQDGIAQAHRLPGTTVAPDVTNKEVGVAGFCIFGGNQDIEGKIVDRSVCSKIQQCLVDKFIGITVDCPDSGLFSREGCAGRPLLQAGGTCQEVPGR